MLGLERRVNHVVNTLYRASDHYGQVRGHQAKKTILWPIRQLNMHAIPNDEIGPILTLFVMVFLALLVLII
jgi:hypothetical protein